ncbi:cyclin-dependent kinase F-3 isoform X2 [Phalaenopsis equestris]|uniref:cyclin-dependent kinase F-3 isoform X2 n=1 Tax=Phalaenopsis equestris TaxID=78828 RepID=UPI0009E5AF66|nr:cyclin-dependent kinase F-3 isoform X2 [Phalaenopsis equestris]XP_020599837.1 cyclin-dependent kinase F-3 isoform X2 [Phalaenopsis equestris]
MERYRILTEIGDGTCGNVYKALNLQYNEIVAVKKMKRKFYYWEECLNLREVKLLQRLNHPNIVKLKEIVKENYELFLIFEHMDCNLYQNMRDRQSPFSELDIRSLMSQVLQGLAYMHRNGYFHRDLKPENLLVKDDIIKIADFGLSREIMSHAPYTDYVSTRWYRAPEVLLQSSAYSPAIDMWAVGAILAELFSLYPLFPGQSETDQIYKICNVLGTPDVSIWPEGMELSGAIGFNFFQAPPANLSSIIPNASLEAIDLIQKLCSWNPQNRLTAEQSLQHPFFHVGTWVPCPLQDLPPVNTNQTGSNPKLDLSLWDFDNESEEDCFLGLTLGVEPSITNLDAYRNSQRSEEEILYCAGYEGHSGQLVFWPLIAPDNNMMNDLPRMTSLASSCMANGQRSLPPFSLPESSAFNIPPQQPNLMDCHLFEPTMSLSSSFQHSFFFQ